MRWALYDKLKVTYPDVKLTYGYITKNTRIKNGLPKDHYIDARCISGKPMPLVMEMSIITKKFVVITDRYTKLKYLKAVSENVIKLNMR